VFGDSTMKKGMLNCRGKMESEFPADADFLCDRPPVTGAVLRNTNGGIRCTWLRRLITVRLCCKLQPALT
jgi:hypothetical protein